MAFVDYEGVPMEWETARNAAARAYVDACNAGHENPETLEAFTAGADWAVRGGPEPDAKDARAGAAEHWLRLALPPHLDIRGLVLNAFIKGAAWTDENPEAGLLRLAGEAVGAFRAWAMEGTVENEVRLSGAIDALEAATKQGGGR